MPLFFTTSRYEGAYGGAVGDSALALRGNTTLWQFHQSDLHIECVLGYCTGMTIVVDCCSDVWAGLISYIQGSPSVSSIPFPVFSNSSTPSLRSVLVRFINTMHLQFTVSRMCPRAIVIILGTKPAVRQLREDTGFLMEYLKAAPWSHDRRCSNRMYNPFVHIIQIL